jgi:hypothetical protein
MKARSIIFILLVIIIIILLSRIRSNYIKNGIAFSACGTPGTQACTPGALYAPNEIGLPCHVKNDTEGSFNGHVTADAHVCALRTSTGPMLIKIDGKRVPYTKS